VPAGPGVRRLPGAGQKLLSESDLAHDSGYGRDTVRHGMQIARDKGYVVITHGIGTFVNTADHWA
jgi:DNA-binding FadR family transcriptional regulator